MALVDEWNRRRRWRKLTGGGDLPPWWNAAQVVVAVVLLVTLVVMTLVGLGREPQQIAADPAPVPASVNQTSGNLVPDDRFMVETSTPQETVPQVTVVAEPSMPQPPVSVPPATIPTPTNVEGATSTSTTTGPESTQEPTAGVSVAVFHRDGQLVDVPTEVVEQVRDWLEVVAPGSELKSVTVTFLADDLFVFDVIHDPDADGPQGITTMAEVAVVLRDGTWSVV